MIRSLVVTAGSAPVRLARGPLLLAWILLAVAYAAGAKLGLTMAFAGGNVSPVWPPAGIALGALLLFGLRVWPGILVGALLANLGGMPWGILLPVALGNVGEGVAACLILRLASADPALTTMRSLWWFLLAVGVAPIISATTGVLSLGLSGAIPAQAQTEAWRTWYLGDAIGMVYLTPVAAVWALGFPTSLRRLPPARLAEALFMGAVVLGVTIAAFSVPAVEHRAVPLSFLLFPLELWATIRFGLPGATLASLGMGSVAVAGTVADLGPFSDFSTLNERLLALHALLGSLAITGLALGAVSQERGTAESDLLLTSASVANAHDFILWLDEQGRLVHANQAAITRLGRSLAELVGRPMSAIAERLGSGSWRHAEDRQTTPVQESALISADGTRIPVEVSITRVADPRLPGIFTCAIARDLTERKAMESRLVQVGKMEALGRLAGGVAHDFNNVLAVIIGYAESVRNRPGLPDSVQKALGHIHTAGERAAGMTSQLLAFSRQQVLEPRHLDLGAAAAEAQPLLERLIGSSIRCRLEQPSTPLTVLADPTQIHQVLMNLAANARDAMPDGGTLTLRLEAVTLDLREARLLARANPHDAEVIRDGRYARLEVRDTGLGMPPEVRTRLFEPFFTTKQSGKGTGLGLSTVHGIVLQSGGFITVESDAGSGTAFRIHLPVSEAQALVAEASGPRPVRLGGPARRILVVDDQTAVRDLVAALLADEGHEVATAADGAEALALARTRPPEVLVTDLVMPGLGGSSLAEALRELHPGLPVVFLSGYPEGQLAGDLPPHSRFIAKPFRRDQLLDAITELTSA